MKFPTVVMPPLKFARYYASIGWPVFPLSPKKKSPATRHGFHDASLDEAQIEAWWSGDQAKCGIGVPTGQTSGIIIVDIDARNGGWGTVERLKAEGKFLPESSVCVNTSGSGADVGRHYYFRFPAGHEILPGMNNAWPGIDIKSDGGYVCVPPTVHPSGSMYAHQSGVAELEDLPAWVLERLQQGRSSAGKRVLADSSEASGLGSKVRQGQRNTHLTRVAGWLRRENHPSESIYATLWEVNRTLCDPPCTEDEVRRVVQSVTRYAPNPDAAVSNVEPDEPVALTFNKLGELFTADIPEPDWIIPHRLAQGDMHMMCGAPEAGKSWFALEMAVAAATMRPIMGLTTIFGRLRSLMIDEENTLDEFQTRMVKLCHAHGITDPANIALLTSNVHYLLQGGANFSTPGYLEKLVEEVREHKPHLIFVDSATALSGVDNENDASKVRAFFRDKLAPLRRICNSTIIVIHHTSKLAYQDEEELTIQLAGLFRGSIDWVASLDSASLLMKQGDEDENPYIKYHTVKQRRGKKPTAPLKIRLVDGADGGCRPLVLNPPADAQPRRPSKLSVARRAVLEYLADGNDVGTRKDLLDATEIYLAGTLQANQTDRKSISNAIGRLASKDVFSYPTDDKESVGQLNLTVLQLRNLLSQQG